MGNLIGYSALRSTNVNGSNLLGMALTNVGTVGTKALPIGARNISLAELNGYTYLAVYKDVNIMKSVFSDTYFTDVCTKVSQRVKMKL
jgi:hypothetical protein